MKIQDCMKINVISIPNAASIADAAAVFVEHHIGLLPVVDKQGKPVGLLRLADMLSLELPDFLDLIADVDFVHDFGAVETTRPTYEQLKRPVTSLMRPVMAVEQTSGLLRAYSLMLQHQLNDIPVVNKAGALVGVASRVDIGTAILSLWSREKPA
jgi:CBS domain-containing protein